MADDAATIEYKATTERLARLESILAAFKELMDEREKRYNAEWGAQRREAAKAFANAEIALTKSEAVKDLAASKLEEATKIHFANVNEFNKRMEKVVSEQASKEWATGFEKSTSARLTLLETAQATKAGEDRRANMQTHVDERKSATSQWVIGLCIFGGLTFLGIIIAIAQLFHK